MPVIVILAELLLNKSWGLANGILTNRVLSHPYVWVMQLGRELLDFTTFSSWLLWCLGRQIELVDQLKRECQRPRRRRC